VIQSCNVVPVYLIELSRRVAKQHLKGSADMTVAIARRLSRSHLTIALFALTLLIATVPAAFAHTHPAMMMPAPDQTVESPDVVMIHFTEAVEPKFSQITVTDSSGHVMNKDASVVSSDAKMVSVAMPKLKAGIYTVNWVAVAVDGHRSNGDYKFTVK
jgi:copper resistance protein C